MTPAISVPLWAARRMLSARDRMLNVVEATLPGEVALLVDVVFGMQKTMIAGVLVSSGIADVLGTGARTPGDLARDLGLNPDMTCRFVDAAVASRLLRLDRRGRACLTRTGGPLRRDHPKSVASWVTYYAHPDTAAAHAHLDAQLREGGENSGYRRAFGKSMWNYFGDHPEVGATFADAMRQMTEIDLAGLVRAYPWPRGGVICDVAGGIGHMLAAILEHRPDARGILLDSPDVIEQAEGYLRERGLADRIERRTGDLFGELDAHADVYTMKWILHDWGDDTCRDILKRVRATMPSGSRLVTIDWHHERGRPNLSTPVCDILMVVCCEGGRERSPQQVQDLMRDAGLTPGRVRHHGLTMLVEGIAP
ncbi:methyltransferase [Mycobacterium sp. NPDC051804]|uniref:methyltransferase n=1 Tax=Mycobacterium sp. NPDC051804 TaxID=3364295 RepID=UPI003797F9E0